MESVPISQGRAENKFQEVERSANLAHLLWWDVGCAWRKALQILSCLVLSVGTFTPTLTLPIFISLSQVRVPLRSTSRQKEGS